MANLRQITKEALEAHARTLQRLESQERAELGSGTEWKEKREEIERILKGEIEP